MRDEVWRVVDQRLHKDVRWVELEYPPKMEEQLIQDQDRAKPKTEEQQIRNVDGEKRINPYSVKLD